MTPPMATSTAMKRSLASLTRMTKWNHHHALPNGPSPGGARRPPSSLRASPFSIGSWRRKALRSDMRSSPQQDPERGRHEVPDRYGRHWAGLVPGLWPAGWLHLMFVANGSGSVSPAAAQVTGLADPAPT